jgi:hypothetical protein
LNQAARMVWSEQLLASVDQAQTVEDLRLVLRELLFEVYTPGWP